MLFHSSGLQEGMRLWIDKWAVLSKTSRLTLSTNPSAVSGKTMRSPDGTFWRWIWVCWDALSSSWAYIRVIHSIICEHGDENILDIWRALLEVMRMSGWASGDKASIPYQILAASYITASYRLIKLEDRLQLSSIAHSVLLSLSSVLYSRESPHQHCLDLCLPKGLGDRW